MAGARKTALALMVLVALSACRQSEQARAHAMQQRAAAHAIVARSAVVQMAATPRAPGRIIYDKPVDLSYASLRATRPDLDSARNAHGSPNATEQGSRNKSRAEERP
jgi:methionine-rich copper-binding protein CopC